MHPASFLRFLLPGVFCLFFWQTTTAQRVLVYDAIFRGDTIGTMRATKSMEGNQTVVKLETRVSVKFVMTFSYVQKLESAFVNGLMVSSSALQFRDGELSEECRGWKDGASYRLLTPDGEVAVQRSRLGANVVSIHWQEPTRDQEVYSVRYGDFSQLKRLDDGRYGLFMTNGDVNYYTYRNGVVSLLEVSYGWLSMEFRLRE